MKNILLMMLVFSAGCVTTDISLNRDLVKPGNSVVILPFKSSETFKDEIYSSSEEKFRSALLDMHFRVIDKEKTELLLKKKEFNTSGITQENIIKTGKLLDVDMVLTGEIIENKEIQRDIRQHGSFMPGYILSGGKNDRNDDVKRVNVYRFNIIVKLTAVSSGIEVFSVKNRYAESEQDEYMPGYRSLDSYRELVLDRMVKELVSEINRKE